MYKVHLPYHSVSSRWSTVTPRRSSTSTEPNLRSIRTQDSFSLQCSCRHADSGEEFGFKDIVIGVGGVFVASTWGGGGGGEGGAYKINVSHQRTCTL